MGPKAPTDAQKKLPGFCIMRRKEVIGYEQPDGSFVQYLYMNDGRMISAAEIVGGITDQDILTRMQTTAGFRSLVKKIGVTIEAKKSEDVNVKADFYFQMYGKEDPYQKGSTLHLSCIADGMERELDLDSHEWNGEEDIPGQIRFAFPKAGINVLVSVKFYLYEEYQIPEMPKEKEIDVTSPEYASMIERCVIHAGNPYRLQKAIEKGQRNEQITIAAIGGSITQGAGAVPINTQCYARKFYEGFLKETGISEENAVYIKAGVGGTPSELGMIRYEEDVLHNGEYQPDIVIVEFAVNDAGDETEGKCFESLVKRILKSDNAPAVLIIFAVFADDWNLQDRLLPVAIRYDIPSVSVKDAICWQFHDPSRQILSRNQYFYDRYHPTNLGHTIMADCLLYLVRQSLQDKAYKDIDLTSIKPVIGDDFTDIRLLDRKHFIDGVIIDPGSFRVNGGDKQMVEKDMDMIATAEFDYNWHYKGNDSKETFQPFHMKLKCKAIVIVMMDSASLTVGCAHVCVDGKEVLYLDPHAVGWTHNTPLICLNEKETGWHEVIVTMDENDYDKTFSISGFGIV